MRRGGNQPEDDGNVDRAAARRSTAAAATTSRPASGSSITCWSWSPGTAASICDLRRERRPRRRPAPHRRGRRHRARRSGVDGARQPARHQPRRLLRHADGRDARRRGDRSRRPRRTRSSICGSRSAASAISSRSCVQDFFEGFAQGARANVHVKVLYGRSSHHQVEAMFKAFARALRFACSRDRRLARMLPSTKELL